MKKIILLVILVFCVSCKSHDDDIGKPENYIFTKTDIANDCNAYQMLFHDGEYIFKFSLAGNCKNLNAYKYINEYSKYLSKHKHKLKNRKGFIILDYCKVNNILVDSIIALTKKSFEAKVSLIEVNADNFKIKVLDK